MRVLLWLFASLLIACSSTVQGAAPTTEHLSDGLTALRQGDKTKAWDLLFPLANAGDVQAMFYLGDMMLRSPEYGDNLERALKFFSVAAKKGHQGAARLLPQVQQMIGQKAAGGLPTIAGVSGMPLQADIARVKHELEQYKQQVLRFTDSPVMEEGVGKLEVLFFSDQSSAAVEKASQLLRSVNRQFGERVKTKLYMTINPAEWSAPNTPIGASSIPPGGVMPDFNGQLAAQHGVTSTPAIVIVPLNGKPTVITDLSALPNLINRLL